MALNTSLTTLIHELENRIDLISPSRREILDTLTNAVRTHLQKHQHAKLIFVCTHNSRRSQLGQLWFKVIAAHYGIDHIYTYSGGTESTAFNHRMVHAVKEAGFDVTLQSEGENPEYLFKLDGTDSGDLLFSKVYHHEYNPQTDFIAVMVCSEADEGCPFVAGATARISLPYKDPKAFDNTPDEAKAYSDKVLEIGRELIYTVKQLKS